MKKALRKTQKGFTLIEVIVAATMFSLLLVVAIGGLVNVLTIYTGASSSRDNQQAMRNITEEIGRRAQFAANMSTPTIAGQQYLCIKPSSADTFAYKKIGGPNDGVIQRANLSTSPTTTTDCVSPSTNLAISSATEWKTISAENISVYKFMPTVILNNAEGTPSVGINVVSLDLGVGVRPKGDLTFFGGQKFKNEFQVQVAFFGLNQ